MNDFMDPFEAADYLGLSRRTLDAWRHRAFGPTYMKFGRKVMYSQEELQRWAKEQQFHGTSEYSSSKKD